jgi:TPR repeat protein
LLECWDGEPDNRPTMQEVVRKLTTIILQKNVYQKFEKMNIKEIGTSTASNEPIMNKNIESENLLMIVDKTIDLINKSINGGSNEIKIKEIVINYITNNCKVNLQEIYTWLLSNQNKSSNLIFLIGCFNYYGICINENHVQAFSLFSKATEENNNLARYYVGLCHEFGEGALKSEEIAFQNYEEVANENYAAGEFKIGLFYDKGIGVKKSPEMATYWYKKAASNGNLTAQFNLAMIYKKEGDNKDYKKAFELFKQLAEKEYSRGISMLGYCYFNGIGTNVDNQKAFELYKKAANLGNSVAQYNLASMYESDVKDIKQAIYWYKASACQGYPNARYRLESLNVRLQ